MKTKLTILVPQFAMLLSVGLFAAPGQEDRNGW